MSRSLLGLALALSLERRCRWASRGLPTACCCPHACRSGLELHAGGRHEHGQRAGLPVGRAGHTGADGALRAVGIVAGRRAAGQCVHGAERLLHGRHRTAGAAVAGRRASALVFIAGGHLLAARLGASSRSEWACCWACTTAGLGIVLSALLGTGHGAGGGSRVLHGWVLAWWALALACFCRHRRAACGLGMRSAGTGTTAAGTAGDAAMNTWRAFAPGLAGYADVGGLHRLVYRL